MIDHSLLRPNLTAEDIKAGCQEALNHGFAAIVVNPAHVYLAAKTIGKSSVKVCSVISFPFGLETTDAKVYEARKALADGAEEIDMVMNFSALKSGNADLVLNDIKSVVDEAKRASRTIVVKVILENCYLSETEKKEVCLLAVRAGADYVKTSTGFGTGGATVEDVKLMRKIVGPRFGVKAAGGIRTLDQVLEMIEAGANRIGTSSSVSILESL